MQWLLHPHVLPRVAMVPTVGQYPEAFPRTGYKQKLRMTRQHKMCRGSTRVISTLHETKGPRGGFFPWQGDSSSKKRYVRQILVMAPYIAWVSPLPGWLNFPEPSWRREKLSGNAQAAVGGETISQLMPQGFRRGLCCSDIWSRGRTTDSIASAGILGMQPHDLYRRVWFCSVLLDA
jgi:hypothetical protein